MSDFKSGLAPNINAMLDYREALGYSRKTHRATLRSLDSFALGVNMNTDILTKELVLGWLEEQHSNIKGKAAAARILGKYMQAIGKDAYVLYDKYECAPTSRPTYIFTDAELATLFAGIDKTKPTVSEPFLHEITISLF